jgi:hypothetical protein
MSNAELLKKELSEVEVSNPNMDQNLLDNQNNDQ